MAEESENWQSMKECRDYDLLRDLMRICWESLVDGLDASSGITDFLVSKGVISMDILEETHTKPTRKQKARFLLQHIGVKSPIEITMFVEGLRSDHRFLFQEVVAQYGILIREQRRQEQEMMREYRRQQQQEQQPQYRNTPASHYPHQISSPEQNPGVNMQRGNLDLHGPGSMQQETRPIIRPSSFGVSQDASVATNTMGPISAHDNSFTSMAGSEDVPSFSLQTSRSPTTSPLETISDIGQVNPILND